MFDMSKFDVALVVFRAEPELPVGPIQGIDAHEPAVRRHLLDVNVAPPNDDFVDFILDLADLNGIAGREIRFWQGLRCPSGI